MMLSCKFAAYFQKMFLQEHHWRGSVQHSELLNFFFLCYRGICCSLFSGNAPANILYRHKYTEWREMKNYVKFKKTIFSKCFSFYWSLLQVSLHPPFHLLRLHVTLSVYNMSFNDFYIVCSKKNYLFYKEFFGVLTGSQNLTPPPSFHLPSPQLPPLILNTNFIKRESEIG